MSFEVSEAPLKGVLLIRPRVFRDTRGVFLESFRKRDLAGQGLEEDFVQDNESRSEAGVVRGLHYQVPPASQGKLVHVVRGEIFDVAVDVRRDSATRGRWYGTRLSEKNRLMLYIPPGFAHGFCALETSDVIYKVTAYYSPEHEKGIAWNDPALKIAWPRVRRGYILSEKDKKYPTLETARAKGWLA